MALVVGGARSLWGPSADSGSGLAVHATTEPEREPPSSPSQPPPPQTSPRQEQPTSGPRRPRHERREGGRRDSWGSSTCSLTSSSSSGGGNSQGTHSFSSTSSGQSQSRCMPATTSRRPRPPGDVHLTVQGCTFEVHLRVLKRKCRVLYAHIRRLRMQSALGDEEDERERSEYAIETTAGSGAFHLRWRDRQRTPRLSTLVQSQRTRCPLSIRPPQVVKPKAKRERRSLKTKSRRFVSVHCLAHDKKCETEAAVTALSSESTASKQYLAIPPDTHSPGKENYATANSTAISPRIRAALASKLPMLSPIKVPTPVVETERSREIMDLELYGADPDAVATLLEFLSTGKTHTLTSANAVQVVQLCKWLCLENRLQYTALAVQIRHLSSVTDWMPVLFACASLRVEDKRRLLIDACLRRLMEFNPAHCIPAMEDLPLHRLAAIEDAGLLSRVLVCLINHVRHLGVWRKLVFALELWLFWSFRRPYVIPESLEPQPLLASLHQPMSLLDFHHQYVPWDPEITMKPIEVAGLDAYVKPTTIFQFGDFNVQVRFELDGLALIQWRVVRARDCSDVLDDVEMENVPQSRINGDAPFALRGRLTVRYRCGIGGPLLQAEAAIRYTHSSETYGKWHVLITAASTDSVAIAETNQDLSEDAKPAPEESSESTMELHSDPMIANTPSDGMVTIRRTAPDQGDLVNVHRSRQIGGEPSDDVFELMTAQFSGQFFAWGHRLCNLYHYLLLATLFYELPSDAPLGLRVDATVQRMQELPLETLVLLLQSDRLRIPGGETTLALSLVRLGLSDLGLASYGLGQLRQLFGCVRWCFVDLEQIMQALERAPRELELYELIEDQLHHGGDARHHIRRTPWGVQEMATPYRPVTTLVEFQIEAGDRSLSPSKFLLFATP